MPNINPEDFYASPVTSWTSSSTQETTSSTQETTPVISLENRDKIFKQRFGVELEFEMDEYELLENLYGTLRLNNVEAHSVKDDGSLSEAGFEVLSKPLGCLKDLYDFMCNTLDVLREKYPIQDYSPTAVHIHVSNIPEPTNLFYLASYFGSVFEHLRRQNRSDLIHQYLNIPVYKEGNEINKHKLEKGYNAFSNSELLYSISKGIDPIYRRESSLCGSVFMRARRSTIRYAGWDGNVPTIEFRILPQRLNKDIYKAYVKIVAGLIKYSGERTTWKIYQLIKADKRGEKPLYIKLKEFMDICGLTSDEMWMMFHNEDTPTIHTEKLPFHVLCMCDEPRTDIDDNHLYMFKQFSEPDEIVGGDEKAIYCRFTNIRRTSLNGGIGDITIVADNSRMYRFEEVDIGNRDLKWAIEHEGVWFALNSNQENPNVPIYIPRALVMSRAEKYDGRKSIMIVNLGYELRNLIMDRDIYRAILNMWNESISYSESLLSV